MAAELRHLDLGPVRLRCALAGEGPLVVLLHGFPEQWFSWNHQIRGLAEAGFRVAAPNLRGYPGSSRPPRTRDYRLALLADDVAALLDALGAATAHVVGHDWGGMVAWAFAQQHPDRLDRLAVLDAPHPGWLQPMFRDPRQLLMSWYALGFQLPVLPEVVLRLGEHAILRRTFQTDPREPQAFRPEDVARYATGWAEPGVIGAGLRYYRALGRDRMLGRLPSIRRIEAPTLVIWGEQDRYLSPRYARPETAWVPDCRVELLPDTSHWVQVDRPERVTALLREHLA